MGRLQRGQRIVIVVGLGVILWLVGQYVSTLGPRPQFGWVAYAPLSGAANGPEADLTPAEDFLVWLGLALIWTACSVFVLGKRTRGESPE